MQLQSQTRFLVLFLLGAFFVNPVLAQDFSKDAAVNSFGDQRSTDRIAKLEKQVILLEREFFKSGGSITSSSATGVDRSTLEVRVSTLEEELRGLRGKIEELEHENAQLKKKVGGANTASVAPISNPQKTVSSVQPKAEEIVKTTNAPASMAGHPNVFKKPESIEEIAKLAPAAGNTEAAKTAVASATSSNSVREQYDWALALITEGQYGDAALAFHQFINQNPDDALTGNAYYWLGETYYVRSDYEQASVFFMEGYKKFPKGTKAPDNILKLAISLANLKKKEEACTSFSMLQSEFPNASNTIKKRAEKEKSDLGCS